MTQPEWLDAKQTREALEYQSVGEVTIHADEEGDIEWIGLTLANGEGIEINAHGEHTEGWLTVERGFRIRRIYGAAE